MYKIISTWFLARIILISVVFACCFIIPLYVQAQSAKSIDTAKIIIKGTVMDEKGLPVVGATVQEKGASDGALTSKDGVYMLEVNANAVLVVRSLNHIFHTEAVKGRTTINITLQSAVNTLSDVEVVATGYQKLNRTQISGATATLSGVDYDKSISSSGNVLANLEGKVAGLVINPLNPNDVSVRGVSTFNAVKQLLIVLDGYPTEISLDAINPNDIESVTLLKDAAASAIYGVRASNGVLVIQTKRGKEGAPVMSFRTTITSQGKPDFSDLDLLAGQGFVDLSLDKKKADGRKQADFDNRFILFNQPYSPIWRTQFDRESGKITADEAKVQFDTYAGYNNINDYSKLFYRNQFSSQFDFDVSGGNDKATYFFGANRIDQNQTVKGTTNSKTTLNLKSTIKLSKRIRFDVAGLYSNVKTEGGIVPSYNYFEPEEHLTDANGKPLPVYTQPIDNAFPRNAATNDAIIAAGLLDQLYYPAQELDGRRISTNDNLMRFQGQLQIKILEGLNLELGGTYEIQDSKTADLSTLDAWAIRRNINYFATPDASGNPVFNFPLGDVLNSTYANTSAYTIRAQANLNRTFAQKHAITALLGIEQRDRLLKSNLGTQFGYNDETLTAIPVNLMQLTEGIGGYFGGGYAATGSFFAPQIVYADYFRTGYTNDRFVSFYGNVAYTYNNKYVATASARIDQSNLFGTDPKYRYKPLWSVGGAWLASKEDFLRNVSWLHNLKLRASYGFNGNVDKTTGPYLIVASGIDGRAPGLIVNTVQSPPNKQLRWEQTATINGGIDFSILKGKIGGSVDYYYKKSTDLLSSRGNDPTSGFSTVTVNNGSILNQGWEFALNTLNINTSKFRWSSQITASFNKNEVLKIEQPVLSRSSSYVTETILQKGQDINTIYSYNYAGVNDAGRPLVYDSKGTKVPIYQDQGVDVTINDMIASGTIAPKYVIGLNNQINIGNFDVYFLFMYYGGHVYRTEAPWADVARPIEGAQNYWKQPGDEATVLQPGFRKAFNGDEKAYQYANIFVHKADYIKLRNLIVTYNIPTAAYKKIGFTNAKIRLQAENLFKVMLDNAGVDPEFVNPVTGVRQLVAKPIYTAALYLNF